MATLFTGRQKFVAISAVALLMAGCAVVGGHAYIDLRPNLILLTLAPMMYWLLVRSRHNPSRIWWSTLLMLFWAPALVAVLSDNKFFSAERPLRLWTALIGVPMLVWFIVDMFANLPSPAGPIVLWALTVLTMVALICVRLYFHLTTMQPPAPVAQGPLPPAA